MLVIVNSDSNWLPWGLGFKKWGGASPVGKAREVDEFITSTLIISQNMKSSPESRCVRSLHSGLIRPRIGPVETIRFLQ
ncbi:hypothetical protein TNCV_4301331 [Trichonephila clavipes]|uniref:Uncharacterized protein n=1 Tax=Trichonephila clavipes TaxID=2585209 RepID=A0A8X6V933_TRICX|nr:hypothetical protein TNCV_4301331 [Trichonephila clavipes]